MPRTAWTEEQRKAHGAKIKATRLKNMQALEDNTVEDTTAKSTIITNDTSEQEPVGIKFESSQTEDYEIVGAKLEVADSEIKSVLEGITEDSEVYILNPTDKGFRVQYTVEGYQSVNLTPEERDVREKAGMPLTKDFGKTVARITNYVTLPPKKITQLPGKVAHVAIIQFRNYLMRTNPDKYADVADPAAIREYEDKIVLKITNRLATIEDPGAEIERRIAELNKSA